MTDSERELRVVVVQVALTPGAVDRNLRHVEDLVGQAALEHHPDLVVLPDGITTPMSPATCVPGAVRPVDGEPYRVLRRLAAEYECLVAGGFAAVRGKHAAATYVLAEADGGTHLHDRDQPTLWENCSLAGGKDDGFASTSIGPVGLVTGLEWARSRTVHRLSGFVSLLVGGTSWVAPTDWSHAPRTLAERDRTAQATAARELAGHLARRVGAPAAVAQQVGATGGPSPSRAILMGESQILDREGRMLQRLSAADGEGYAAAKVSLAEPPPPQAAPSSFWLPSVPRSTRLTWGLLNAQGRWRYRRDWRAGAFPWQGKGGDHLMAYNPPVEAPQARPERQIVANPYGLAPLPPSGDRPTR